MVWTAHPLLGGNNPVGALHDVFQLGTGGAGDVGLNLRRIGSAGRHRGVENADAHDACTPRRAGRAEAIKGRRIPLGHTVEFAARSTAQSAEARRHRWLVRAIVQRRSCAAIQASAAGVPHGRPRAGRAARGDLHGGRACMGYDRGAKRGLLRSAHRQSRQCSSALATGCRNRRQLRQICRAWPPN
jgi:hypothetical protein